MSARKVLRYTLVVRHPETTAPTALLAGKPVPKWARELVQDEDLTTESSQDDEEDTDSGATPKAVEDMTVAELKAEIDTRNEGREDADKMAKSGTQAELVERLKADAAARA